MIPATIASVLILYWYWRENRPEPGEPPPGSVEALQRELASLNTRLDAVLTRLKER